MSSTNTTTTTTTITVENTPSTKPVRRGARVPTGSLASIRSKLSAMFPNASASELARASVLCISERNGVEFISELGLS